MKEALKINMELNDKGFKTWFSSIKQQMQILKIEHIIYTTDENEINYQINKLKKTIKDKYSNDWKNEMNIKKVVNWDFIFNTLTTFLSKAISQVYLYHLI